MFNSKEELKQFILETVIESVKENGQLTQEISRSLVFGYEMQPFPDFNLTASEKSGSKNLPGFFK